MGENLAKLYIELQKQNQIVFRHLILPFADQNQVGFAPGSCSALALGGEIFKKPDEKQSLEGQRRLLSSNYSFMLSIRC